MKKKKLTYLQRLKEAIQREGTNTEVAEQLGISPQYLGDILNGHKSLSNAVAYKITTVLGIDGFTLLEEQLESQWHDYLRRISEDGYC